MDASRLDAETVDAIARVSRIDQSDDVRRAASLGKSYPDLVAARQPHLARVTDAVVRPQNAADVERIIAICVERDIAVVPLGGGTSVVGGVEPIGRSTNQAVITLDLADIDDASAPDMTARTATFGAGIRAPRLEQLLAPRGLTLGHVPQSFELATLGGFIATRSSGQASLRFGKIESMTAALDVVTPEGLITVDHLPAHGAGPDVRELLMGSEGTFGVITRATMRLAPRPERVRFSSFAFASFAEAVIAARTLVQAGITPTMVRVSDEAETAFNVGASAPRMVRGTVGRRIATAFGLGRASLVFVVTTGSAAEVAATERRVAAHMKRAGSMSVGAYPARSWYRSRFEQPFARDLLIDRGMLVDTLETAAPWTVIERLHHDVTAALTAAIGPERAVVGCHLSHLYRDGASAYFTFLASVDDEEALSVWRAAKQAAHAAIERNHAATSHQHGVGTMHHELYERRTSAIARTAFAAVRTSVGAAGIMNPGKLDQAPAPGIVPINHVGAAPLPLPVRSSVTDR